MVDLEEMEKMIKAEHDRLTAEYHAAHETLAQSRAVHDLASRALTTFRSKYGEVLKAIEKKAGVS